MSKFKVGDKVRVKKEVLADLENITGIPDEYRHEVEGVITVRLVWGESGIDCNGWSFLPEQLELADKKWSVEFVEDAWETLHQYDRNDMGATNALLVAILKVSLVMLVKMERR